jgi:citrate synthase
MREWLDRDEALGVLGVRPQTLYAYVSRGRIERRFDPADPRRSLYRGDDILALTSRRARGKRPGSIAESAIAWGEPVITTGVSTVIHGRLIFRGIDAVALAERATLEDVAALLWEQPTSPVFTGSGEEADPFLALAGLIADARPSVGRPVGKLCGDAVVAVGVLAARHARGGPDSSSARAACRP